MKAKCIQTKYMKNNNNIKKRKIMIHIKEKCTVIVLIIDGLLQKMEMEQILVLFMIDLKLENFEKNCIN